MAEWIDVLALDQGGSEFRFPTTLRVADIVTIVDMKDVPYEAKVQAKIIGGNAVIKLRAEPTGVVVVETKAQLKKLIGIE